MKKPAGANVLPRRIWVEGRTWTIERTKGLLDSESARGLADSEKRTIEIDASLRGNDVFWVFMHELGHAIMHEAGVSGNAGGVSELAEEIICDKLAYTLQENFYLIPKEKTLQSRDVKDESARNRKRNKKSG